MKTLIVYATKYGATRQIGESIAAQMGGAALYDVNSHAPIAIDEYDCIVLGSPLTAGMVRKEIKAFAEKNADVLAGKRLGIFVSGLQADGGDEYLTKNFPAALLDSARAKAFLGGVFDPAKCGWVARAVIKAVAKLEAYTSAIDEERIASFARELRG